MALGEQGKYLAVGLLTCSIVFAAACNGGSGGSSSHYRTIDGSENNGGTSSIGQAGIHLLRMSSQSYEDSISSPSGADRPNARQVSSDIFSQTSPAPNSRGLSSYVWMWGQFVDHDITLTPEHSPAESFSISVPAGDPWFDPEATGSVTISLGRSTYDEDTGTDALDPRQQINTITAWLDGSVVYGSDDDRALWLRTGEGGKLKTSAGDLLPFNDGSQDNVGGSSTDMMVAGDVRGNENLTLTSLHTLLVREHNRLADSIILAQPELSDEEVYQHARKMIGGLLQNITYNEYLPALLGEGAIPAYDGYRSDIDPSITTEFSTVFYRMGHSLIPSEVLRVEEDGSTSSEGNLELRDAFFRSDRLVSEGGIDSILRGAATQLMEEFDVKMIDDLRNFLFGAPGSGGFDLVALNIQRGRDHGLGNYNHVREAIGLPAVSDFSEVTSDTELVENLRASYGELSLLDAWTAMFAEDKVSGASVGLSTQMALVRQFTDLRDGDRFWFENDGGLSDEEKQEIRETRLSDVIKRNTEIESIQDNVFFAN